MFNSAQPTLTEHSAMGVLLIRKKITTAVTLVVLIEFEPRR